MRRGRSGRGALAACAAAALLAAVPRAGAHIVYGTPTLRGLVADADLVARARIERVQSRPGPDDLPRPFVEARLLEVLKGPAGDETLRFAQHGHGVAEFAPGDEVLIFLRRIERTRELAALGSELDWVSLQEHDARYPIEPASRDELLAAVRAYAGLAAIDAPEARIAALRRITLDLLDAKDERLARSALRDVVLAQELPLLTAADVPRLEAKLRDPKAPIGVRVGLLAELERRKLVDAPAQWAHLLDTTQGPDRLAVIRAAGHHPSAPVTARLVALLGANDAGVAATAAVALGAPQHAAAVAPLARSLAQGGPRLRRAAVRGLGRIGTPEARAALAEAAAEHPDPATRRRAAAEIRLLDTARPGTKPGD